MSASASNLARRDQLAILETVGRALSREAHHLHRWPELTWQQLYNDIQWEGERVHQELAAECDRKMQRGATPWLHRRTRIRQTRALISVLEGHNESVAGVAMSPDARFAVSWDMVDTRIWDVLTGEERAVLKGHTWSWMGHALHAVALSPDGAFVVTGGPDETIRVWDARTGALRAVLEGHTEPVRAVAVSPDGSLIVSWGEDETVRIWNSRTGTRQGVLKDHSDVVTTIAMSPNGTFVAWGDGGGTVRIWNIRRRGQPAVLEGHTYSVKAVAVSPDGTFVVSGSSDKTVRIWDARTGQERAKGFNDGPVEAVAVGPNGTFVVSGGPDTTVMIWDARTGATRAILGGHSGGVATVAVSPDGTFLVSGSADGTVRIWDTGTKTERGVLRGHTGPVETVAVSPDGTFVVSGGQDKTVRIWDARTAQESAWEGHYAELRLVPSATTPWADIVSGVAAVAVSPDGTFVASGGQDGTVRIWDSRTRVQRAVTKWHHFDGPVRALAVSPDASFVVSGGHRKVRIWDARTGAARAVLRGNANFVNAVAASPDGTFVASGGQDGTVRIWDARTGAKRAVLKGHTFVQAVAVSPDGVFVVSGGSGFGDRGVRLWDARTGRERPTPWIDTSGVNAVAVSPDGTFVVTGSHDKTVRMWDLLTTAAPVTLEGHTDSVQAVAVSPDGTFVASGDEDGTVRIWDTRDGGAERAVMGGHTGPVAALAVSPDGAYLVSGSKDGTVRVWDTQHEEGVAVLPLLGTQDCVAWHPWRPAIASGDSTGSVNMMDLETVELGPIVVTAIDVGSGLIIRCPACFRDFQSQEDSLGQVIACPTTDCGLRLRINPFVVKRSVARGWLRPWWRRIPLASLLKLIQKLETKPARETRRARAGTGASRRRLRLLFGILGFLAGVAGGILAHNRTTSWALFMFVFLVGSFSIGRGLGHVVTNPPRIARAVYFAILGASPTGVLYLTYRLWDRWWLATLLGLVVGGALGLIIASTLFPAIAQEEDE